MKIGVLKTGDVNEALVGEYGEYADMFARLLHAVDPALEFLSIDLVAGEMPHDPHQADGWLITGSRFGVYDDLPWIDPLKAFLRDALAQKVPVVGICFGHQILAEAMGGTAIKSDKGWGLGVHEYTAHAAPKWMDGLRNNWTGHAVHQDQVVTQPPNTHVIAQSDFCKFAALAYGDIEKPLAISVQPHPEFTEKFVQDLIDVRLGALIPADIVDPAQEKLGTLVDNAEWAKTIVQFFKQSSSASGSD